MEGVISTTIKIVLTLGLFAWAILGQVSGTKDISQKSLIDQTKVEMMISDGKMISGTQVKNYLNKKSLKVDVDLIDETDVSKDKDSTSITGDIDDIVDEALFSIEKTYDSNGNLEDVDIDQVDLERTY